MAVSRLFLDDLDDQFVHSGDEIDHDDDDFEVLSWLGASHLCIGTIATVPTSPAWKPQCNQSWGLPRWSFLFLLLSFSTFNIFLLAEKDDFVIIVVEVVKM